MSGQTGLLSPPAGQYWYCTDIMTLSRSERQMYKILRHDYCWIQFGYDEIDQWG